MNSVSIELREAADRLSRQGHKLFTVVGPKGFCVLVDDTYNYTAEQLILLVNKRLKPGTRIWSRVMLTGDIPDIESTGLMTSVGKEYEKTTRRDGMEIYREQIDGGHVFYFSPEAAVLIPEGYQTTPCLKPDLSRMQRQQLP